MSEAKFKKAVSIIGSLPKDGPVKPSQEDRLFVSNSKPGEIWSVCPDEKQHDNSSISITSKVCIGGKQFCRFH